MNECFGCGFWDSEWEACTCSYSDKWYACPIESKKPENIKCLEEYCTALNDTDIEFNIPEENVVNKMHNNSLAKAISNIGKE